MTVAVAYEEIYAAMSPFTMSPRNVYVSNLLMADQVRHIPGGVVECGVWRGGMIGGVAMLLGNEREYWLFDSFEGLPPIEDIDGPFAHEWISRPGHDNCYATQDEADEAMRLTGTRYHLVKGWFNQTLTPQCRPAFPDGIAWLRIDADWYTSMTQCLDALFPLVNPGGIISIDDYYMFDGCAKAVHDYLSRNDRAERLRFITGAEPWEASNDGCCYITKL